MATPVDRTKPWHQSDHDDIRNYLVDRLMKSIYPASLWNGVKEERLIYLETYARKVEAGFYAFADSKNEYFSLLARRICNIDQSLDEARESMVEEMQQRQGQQQLMAGQRKPPQQTLQPMLSPQQTLQPATSPPIHSHSPEEKP